MADGRRAEPMETKKNFGSGEPQCSQLITPYPAYPNP